MPSPRIFVSSTYYDLKHVREIIRQFIKDLGYEPILSEFSDILYHPGDMVQNSCLGEISSCDIFVLIVGKRYGSIFPGDILSITHREYIEAQNQSIPIYSFVDLDVLHDFEFYKKNLGSSSYNYRVVEDENTFGLIEDIQNASTDNALIPFTSITDIIHHLKKQWASLFKSYLHAKQLDLNTQKPEVEIHEDFEEFKKKFEIIFGIAKLTQEDLNKAKSIRDLIEKLNGMIEERSTDLKISISGHTVHVGKSVIEIMDNELRSIKTT